jgi:uncharacterized membrane protein YfcA
MSAMSPIELGLAAGAIAVGGLVHGSMGLGFVLIAGPVVALIEPAAVPALFVLLGFPMGIWMVLRERAALDRPGLMQMVGGRVIGTLAAFLVLVVVSRDLLTVLTGSAIVIAAGLSWRMVGFRSGAATKVLAGSVSGLMATVGAVGGPALALAYQDREAPELRATLAATFLATDVFPLAALVVSGFLHWWHVQLAVMMLPAELVGVGVSGLLLRRLDPAAVRVGVLLIAAAGGIAVVLKAIL